jgi:hypothetical protein
MKTTEQLNEMTNGQLVAYYNDINWNAYGAKEIQKFRDKQTGVTRVVTLQSKICADGLEGQVWDTKEVEFDETELAAAAKASDVADKAAETAKRKRSGSVAAKGKRKGSYLARHGVTPAQAVTTRLRDSKATKEQLAELLETPSTGVVSDTLVLVRKGEKCDFDPKTEEVERERVDGVTYYWIA